MAALMFLFAAFACAIPLPLITPRGCINASMILFGHAVSIFGGLYFHHVLDSFQNSRCKKHQNRIYSPLVPSGSGNIWDLGLRVCAGAIA